MWSVRISRAVPLTGAARHAVRAPARPGSGAIDRLLDVGRVTGDDGARPSSTGRRASSAGCSGRGVVVSAGHTNATAEVARAAFDLGVSTVTHLFNAMRPFRSRDPGIIGVALTRPEVYVQLIVDGHHLADETVLLVWAASGGRLALVSDATAGAAVGGGSHQLGDVAIEVADGVPMREDGVLAGTVLTMIDAVRNLHALGVPFEDAVGAATTVPARIVGRSDIGTLEPGGAADVVVLDDRLDIVNVLCAVRSQMWLDASCVSSRRRSRAARSRDRPRARGRGARSARRRQYL